MVNSEEIGHVIVVVIALLLLGRMADDVHRIRQRADELLEHLKRGRVP